MEFLQGDIVSVDFPFSDGAETKRRPALILSGTAINNQGDMVLMQITSKSRRDRMTIPLDNKDLTAPLPLKSFLRVHKIFTLDKNLVIRKLSHVEKTKFNRVIDSLFTLLKE